MKTLSTNVSRRSFLTGATAAGALAALGLAGCAPLASTGSDWLGADPELAEGDLVEIRETELLIIGAGNGGMAAAATEADLGLDFTLCE